jgi:hypothetical protein
MGGGSGRLVDVLAKDTRERDGIQGPVAVRSSRDSHSCDISDNPPNHSLLNQPLADFISRKFPDPICTGRQASIPRRITLYRLPGALTMSGRRRYKSMQDIVAIRQLASVY